MIGSLLLVLLSSAILYHILRILYYRALRLVISEIFSSDVSFHAGYSFFSISDLDIKSEALEIECKSVSLSFSVHVSLKIRSLRMKIHSIDELTTISSKLSKMILGEFSALFGILDFSIEVDNVSVENGLKSLRFQSIHADISKYSLSMNVLSPAIEAKALKIESPSLSIKLLFSGPLPSSFVCHPPRLSLSISNGNLNVSIPAFSISSVPENSWILSVGQTQASSEFPAKFEDCKIDCSFPATVAFSRGNGLQMDSLALKSGDSSLFIKKLQIKSFLLNFDSVDLKISEKVAKLASSLSNHFSIVASNVNLHITMPDSRALLIAASSFSYAKGAIGAKALSMSTFYSSFLASRLTFDDISLESFKSISSASFSLSYSSENIPFDSLLAAIFLILPADRLESQENSFDLKTKSFSIKRNARSLMLANQIVLNLTVRGQLSKLDSNTNDKIILPSKYKCQSSSITFLESSIEKLDSEGSITFEIYPRQLFYDYSGLLSVKGKSAVFRSYTPHEGVAFLFSFDSLSFPSTDDAFSFTLAEGSYNNFVFDSISSKNGIFGVKGQMQRGKVDLISAETISIGGISYIKPKLSFSSGKPTLLSAAKAFSSSYSFIPISYDFNTSSLISDTVTFSSFPSSFQFFTYPIKIAKIETLSCSNLVLSSIQCKDAVWTVGKASFISPTLHINAVNATLEASRQISFESLEITITQQFDYDSLTSLNLADDFAITSKLCKLTFAGQNAKAVSLKLDELSVKKLIRELNFSNRSLELEIDDGKPATVFSSALIDGEQALNVVAILSEQPNSIDSITVETKKHHFHGTEEQMKAFLSTMSHLSPSTITSQKFWKKFTFGSIYISQFDFSLCYVSKSDPTFSDITTHSMTVPKFSKQKTELSFLSLAVQVYKYVWGFARNWILASSRPIETPADQAKGKKQPK